MYDSIAVKTVLNAFKPLIEKSVTGISKIGYSVPLPEFSEEIISQLCEETTLLLSKRPTLLKCEPPIYVVGDIHGNLLDLIRIFSLAKTPPLSRFLFLGDYVDRGSCSVEVVCLLYAFQLMYPEHVYMIRGNHEFESINATYGFYDEVVNYYSIELFQKINRSFEYLPIAAIINNQIFCVHGGLSPHLKTLSQIEAITRPFKTYESDFVADMLWSDPSLQNTCYVRSNRGSGVTFGKNEVLEFLDKFNFNAIFRAHQCVKEGIQKFGSTPLYTIFSSSNYDEASNNRAGLLYVSKTMEIEFFSLPPIVQLDKGAAITTFIELPKNDDDESKILRPTTLNVKLKELFRLPRSSVGIVKVKKAVTFEKYFNNVQRAESLGTLPYLSIQK
jgi:serine/threonine-protein phosphatase PP1 catalytic subunit